MDLGWTTSSKYSGWHFFCCSLSPFFLMEKKDRGVGRKRRDSGDAGNICGKLCRVWWNFLWVLYFYESRLLCVDNWSHPPPPSFPGPPVISCTVNTQLYADVKWSNYHTPRIQYTHRYKNLKADMEKEKNISIIGIYASEKLASKNA